MLSLFKFPLEVRMSHPEANEQFLRRWFEEVWNQKNESVIDEMLAKDCKAYGLADPDTVIIGPEGFKTLHRTFCGAFPDLYFTVEDVIAAGDRVAASWRATGTHLGDHLGFPPTGRSVTLDGATIGIIHDGKLQEGWNLMDMGHFFESLRPDPPRT